MEQGDLQEVAARCAAAAVVVSRKTLLVLLLAPSLAPSSSFSPSLSSWLSCCFLLLLSCSHTPRTLLSPSAKFEFGSCMQTATMIGARYSNVCVSYIYI